MAKKIDNRILLALLLILIAIFIVSRVIKINKTEKSFKTELVSIDTANISSIIIYPKAENHQEIKFKKESGKWLVSKDMIVSASADNSVEGLLSQLMNIKPRRLASRSPEKWEEFHVNDSLATRVKITEKGEKVTLDMMIGKFTYQQSQNPYGGQGNVTGTTFVRLLDEDEVYAVDGFLTMGVNREFNSWRDQKIADTRKGDVTKIVFRYPADSGFTAVRRDSLWVVDGMTADSLKMDQFLSKLAYMNHNQFADGYNPSSSPDYAITIEGNNFSPLSIQAFQTSEEEFVINSSINPSSFFQCQRENIFSDLFKPKSYFFSADQDL